mmetsp:Transcript_33653/g.77643  ORF Transcript_33653/g.77643 Transcript_33653/m.77643 type:complete len:207 (-) Transcript_33653:77-697(-)|eukprot:CAMPEP_0116842548 /NCGR_PEP_ID=MMETSP0418-20121206/11580_1 /TAXON_ID=1158023 /ORGANISM="Astrosyne radiata, Strain 13vi08-1A" /LENGTH=206 /DNA_ID=CAMNT_0004473175 /DNA_START=153 /DNA_END=773 /DNA_ORIENTATION=-
MSSIPFERYDDEFQSLTTQIEESLEEDGGDASFTINLIQQCDDLLKQMSLEARGVQDATVKRDLLEKVRHCKSQLQSLKSRQDVRQEESNARTLLGAPADDSNSAGRQRLLDATQQLERQNETLSKAQRVMAETEDVALEITSELGRNREVLETAHGRVKDMGGLTNRARRLLQNMNRRAVQQKLVLYGVAAIIVVIVAIVLWNIG